MISVTDVRQHALKLLEGAPAGEGLDEISRILIELAAAAAVTSLDVERIEFYAARALAAGATAEQVHEVLVLVSGLGVHTLMMGTRTLGLLLLQAGDSRMTSRLDERQAELWRARVAGDPFWDSVEREIPGFLDSLLRLDPIAFDGFFQYCSLPWKTHTLSAMTKELMAMAVDATPTHRFLPGVRLHLRNALQLGAGRVAVLGALELAAKAAPHVGVGQS